MAGPGPPGCCSTVLSLFLPHTCLLVSGSQGWPEPAAEFFLTPTSSYTQVSQDPFPSGEERDLAVPAEGREGWGKNCVTQGEMGVWRC